VFVALDSLWLTEMGDALSAHEYSQQIPPSDSIRGYLTLAGGALTWIMAKMLAQSLQQLDPRDSHYATQFVERLFAAALKAEASDIHLQPTTQGLDVAWRLDGVLQPIGVFSRGDPTDVVARLKVLAKLLTYRNDVPQEGRVGRGNEGGDWRVCTFPTLHGERAVVRLTKSTFVPRRVAELGLPPAVLPDVERVITQTSGAFIVCGPAGSGKTTTAYALIRELVANPHARRCIVTIEDPIEAALDGVAQAQINDSVGFDLATGLRSVLRQDPEVVLVGEIRDRDTAEGVFNAALTGHLVLSTFHATSAAGAVSRLAELGIEPYLLRSGLLGVLHQRLVRKLCACSLPIQRTLDFLGLPVSRGRHAAGCESCQQTGYQGRIPLAEFLRAEPTELGRAILSRDDAARLELLAREAGLVPVSKLALQAIENGDTSPQEVRRVLGGHC
jgi:general secretion pathway protein E